MEWWRANQPYKNEGEGWNQIQGHQYPNEYSMI